MSLFSPQDNVWEAVKRGDLDAVRAFVERDGVPDCGDRHDESLLTLACAAGHLEVVRFLLEMPRVIRPQFAPEAFAAMRHGHLDVLRLLLEYGLDAASAVDYSRHGPSLVDAAIEQKTSLSSVCWWNLALTLKVRCLPP